MTPQLQQAIKLLALSNLEIETFIAEEIEKNPLLDAQVAARKARTRRRRSGGDFEGDSDARRPGRCERIAGQWRGGGRGRARRGFRGGDLPPRQRQRLDRRARRQPRHERRGRRRIGGRPRFRQYADSALSLADHLMGQAGASVDGADLFVARI
jgi:RNA polymerase sigma-54 factor